MRLRSRAIAGALLPLLTVALLACTPQEKKTAAPPIDSKPVPVGSEACTPCHADIAEKHKATNHAITLYPATISALKELAPPNGELRPGLVIHRLDDKLMVGQKNPVNGTIEPITVALALGSGKSGMTFLVDNGDSVTEICRSYFPRQKVWRITPGQEETDPTLIGHTHDQTVTRKCISCHAVTAPEQPLIPERKFFGVGCESCHGPGSTHVATGAKMQSLKTLDGKAMNTLCGRCHRTTDDIKEMGKHTEDSTNRFQPYGLSLSKCFTKSQGKLSCITCHNPHEDASKDIPKYEATCIACHDGAVKDRPACPVNQKKDCVRCHMPTRDIFPGEPRIPIGMADHFIRIFKK